MADKDKESGVPEAIQERFARVAGTFCATYHVPPEAVQELIVDIITVYDDYMNDRT